MSIQLLPRRRLIKWLAARQTGGQEINILNSISWANLLAGSMHIPQTCNWGILFNNNITWNDVEIPT